VAFLPSFPARIEKLTARVGGPVEPPLITLSSGRLVALARLNPAQRALLREGMAVELVSELYGTTARGTVETIGEIEQDDDGGGSHPLRVTAMGEPFDERLAGVDVRITVEAAASAGEVLVVPLAAVFADADGSVAVLRHGQDGDRRIAVIPGTSGDGYVAITPANGANLAPGDLVVIGAAGTP
jgi:HlyD family secretion protein